MEGYKRQSPHILDCTPVTVPVTKADKTYSYKGVEYAYLNT